MLIPSVSFIMKEHYKISEAAAYLGVCTKTIRRWEARGEIACKPTVGGHRRISIFEISRLIEDYGKVFSCHACGLTLDADLNAARNIIQHPFSLITTRGKGGRPLSPPH